MANDGDIILFSIGHATDHGPLVVLKLILLTVTNLVLLFISIAGTFFRKDVYGLHAALVVSLWAFISIIAIIAGSLTFFNFSITCGKAVLKLWWMAHVMVYYSSAIISLRKSNDLLTPFFPSIGSDSCLRFEILGYQLIAFAVALCVNGFALTRRFLIVTAVICTVYYITMRSLSILRTKKEKVFDSAADQQLSIQENGRLLHCDNSISART